MMQLRESTQSPVDKSIEQGAREKQEDSKFRQLLEKALSGAVSLFGLSGDPVQEWSREEPKTGAKSPQQKDGEVPVQSRETSEQAEDRREVAKHAESSKGETAEENSLQENRGAGKSEALQSTTFSNPGISRPLPGSKNEFLSLEAARMSRNASGVAREVKTARRPGLAEETLRIIRIMEARGETRYRGILKIPLGKLGRLGAEIELESDQLTIRLLVAREEMMSLARSEFSRLREELARQGFENLNLQLELTSDQGQGEEGERADLQSPENIKLQESEVPSREEWQGLVNTLA
jgi:hypothetical protein